MLDLVAKDSFSVLVECISDVEPENVTIFNNDEVFGEVVIDMMDIRNDSGMYIGAANVTSMLGVDFTVSCNWTFNDTELSDSISLLSKYWYC